MSLDRFCRKPVATVGPEQSIRDAAAVMKQSHVGAVVVVDGARKPVGILTDRDVVTRVVAEDRDPEDTRVHAVMSAHPQVVRKDDFIEEAALKMRIVGVRRLPIVDSDGKLAGVVALDDLIVLLSAELSQTATAVRINKGP